MGLKIAENLDAGADIDIDIGSNDDDSTSDSNTTTIIDSETEDNARNTSDTFTQFKALLQHSINCRCSIYHNTWGISNMQARQEIVN